MWSPLSKLLEQLARLRLPRLRIRRRLEVGQAGGADHLGSTRWRLYLRPRVLATTWGPQEDGPWWPFHCLTLFAALDYLQQERIGPLREDPLPLDGLRPPAWLDASTLLIVDLPGPQSVALGATLAVRGCDLVATFNNWPHPKGVLRSEDTLAALLRYAAWLHDERQRPATPAPVAWLCDSTRLGNRSGQPGEFDNRYYLEDALLPGPAYLRERGIGRIVYLHAEGAAVLADLGEHLLHFRQQGLEVRGAALSPQARIGELQELPLRDARFRAQGFLMAAGGGFGATVPHPSSGG